MNMILFAESELDALFVGILPRNDERYSHVRKVLRLSEGDTFISGIINGMEGHSRILRLDETALGFVFTPERPCRPLYPLRLIIGFPRPIQLRRLLRDAASLGVGAVWLTGTELGEKSYRDSTLVEKGAAYAALVEGCSQGRGAAVPELRLFNSVSEVLSVLAEEPHLPVLLDVEDPCCPLHAAPLDGVSSGRPLILAIGSERGWTGRERKLFREAGFMVCSLGTRILRTETAVTAAAALGLARLGCMDSAEKEDR